DENRVNVIATPMLLASNNRPASLRIGEERRFTDGVTTDTVASTAGTTQGTTVATSQQQIGTSLMMLPKINADRTVTLTVFQERTGDDTGKMDLIPISSDEVVSRPVVSNATTVNTIVARDGLTMAIGGLIEERVVRRQLKVPMLGDLPVLGALFRKEFSQDRKTELVVLITPHVISTPGEAAKITQGRLETLSSHNYVRNGFQDQQGHNGINNLPPNYGEGMPNSLYQILPGRFQLK
ncbi:MAG: type II and III secretion system protein, partial [Planctomycetaceae bacterium]|nr:type II and III secretion system protein [Planctomycetaceae bacterium]